MASISYKVVDGGFTKLGSNSEDFPCGLPFNCDDPAYALAHPDICGQPQTMELVLAPETATIKVGQALPMAVFLRVDGTDLALTSELTFTSSNHAVATVSGTGEVTGVGDGVVTIGVTWRDMAAHSQITVIQECGSVAIALIVDTSKSASQDFGGAYASRLLYAKYAAQQFITHQSTNIVYYGVVGFDTVIRTLTLTQDSAAASSYVTALAQSANLTDLGSAIAAASNLLSGASVNRKVIAVLSDGENHPVEGVTSPDPADAARTFKDSGGIVVCLGLRASGPGFSLLNQIASVGYFLNSYPTVADAVTDVFSNLREFFCAGVCGYPGYDSACPTVVPGAQIVDPSPLEDIEVPPPPTEWTVTRSCTQCCDNDPTRCVTSSATYTSQSSEQDAIDRATADACAAARQDLVCDIAAQLSGLVWELPCLGALGDPNGCYCGPGITPVATRVVGTPGRTYNVTIRLRGVIELNQYQPIQDGYWRADGAASNYINRYALSIDDPPQHYWLNNTPLDTIGFVPRFATVDYTMTIQVANGCTVLMTADAGHNDQNEHNNAGNAVVTVGVDDPPIRVTQPYDGQFLQMDVVSIT